MTIREAYIGMTNSLKELEKEHPEWFAHNQPWFKEAANKALENILIKNKIRLFYKKKLNL